MDTRSVSSSNSLASYSQISQLQSRQLRSAEGAQAPSASTVVQNTSSINNTTAVSKVNETAKSTAPRTVENQSSVSQSTPSSSPSDPVLSKRSSESTQSKEQETVELEQVKQLSQRDREVRSHEAAHAAAGGQHTGAPSYTYTRGPDGNLYATGGQVSVDTSGIANDPEATIAKAETVIRSALAPANPSPQDIKVAAEAQAMLITAQAELALKATEEEGQVVSSREDRVEVVKTESDEDVFEVRGVDKEKFRENIEGIENRLELSREQQELFADQLQELKSRVGTVLQQFIDTGATEGVASQGTFIDVKA